MTDAQIDLYASLRVAVPTEWRISLSTGDGMLVVYTQRPVYAEPGPLAPGFARFFRLPNRQIVGTERLAVAVSEGLIEARPESRRHLVRGVLDKIDETEATCGDLRP